MVLYVLFYGFIYAEYCRKCISVWFGLDGGLYSMPVSDPVLVKFKAASYLSLRRRISRPASEMCFCNSSIWSRQCLSFTAYSLETDSSTAACISSTGVLQRP